MFKTTIILLILLTLILCENLENNKTINRELDSCHNHNNYIGYDLNSKVAIGLEKINNNTECFKSEYLSTENINSNLIKEIYETPKQTLLSNTIGLTDTQQVKRLPVPNNKNYSNFVLILLCLLTFTILVSVCLHLNYGKLNKNKLNDNDLDDSDDSDESGDSE